MTGAASTLGRRVVALAAEDPTVERVVAIDRRPLHRLPAGVEGHVWATGGKELFRSEDGAKTFVEVANVEESYAVGFGHPAPGQRYPVVYLSGKVSGVTGFFRSEDMGASFARINDDMHQYGGANLIIGDPRVYGRVYVAPGGRGILYGEPAK